MVDASVAFDASGAIDAYDARMPGVLLTPAEVAARLRISVRTAQRLIRVGLDESDGLKGIRVGRQLRVEEEEVLRYVRRRTEFERQTRLPFR